MRVFIRKYARNGVVFVLITIWWNKGWDDKMIRKKVTHHRGSTSREWRHGWYGESQGMASTRCLVHQRSTRRHCDLGSLSQFCLFWVPNQCQSPLGRAKRKVSGWMMLHITCGWCATDALFLPLQVCAQGCKCFHSLHKCALCCCWGTRQHLRTEKDGEKERN